MTHSVQGSVEPGNAAPQSAVALEEDDVRSFRDACKADGIELTMEEARFRAIRLMRLLDLLSRPLSAERGLLADSDSNAKIEKSAGAPSS